MASFINNTVSLIAAFSAMLFLFRRKVRTSDAWHATVIPLASIIGSGFLVSTPLLLLTSGRWAVVVMLVIVLIAYALGSSLRFNIQCIEPIISQSKNNQWINRIEGVSRTALGIAYIISITFYLKLLSAFALHGIGISNNFYENILTSLIILLIGIVGKVRGLSVLKVLETYSVNVKLAIIFSAIVAYFFYNGELITKGQWILKSHPHEFWWNGFRKVLGMLIIIQGFETSRYIGKGFDARLRIKTMRYAQWISAAIYLSFTAVSMVVFNDIQQVSETTVIDLCHIVAPVLPFLLIVAAVMSQFSAAVADTIGSGGLLVESTRQRLSLNDSYLLITLLALLLIWLTNIYEIIVIASKAFSVYYALQIILTLITAWRKKARMQKMILYVPLLILMLLVIIFGIPIE